MHCDTSSGSKQDGAFDRALAALRKVPRSILAVLGVLALGLGVNTAMFTVSCLEFDGLYPHPDELVVIRPETQGRERGISARDFVNWRQGATVFQVEFFWGVL